VDKNLNEGTHAKRDLVQMLNNFQSYVKKYDLIPVEYKIVGNENNFGVWVKRNSTDAEIKRAIKRQIKVHGGRWLGKYTKPNDADRLMKLTQSTMDEKVNKGKVIKNFENKLEEAK
jgi:hypothetical protein